MDAGVLPAKQITRHDSSLLYSAELLFVVVVVCFYFFCWSWNGDICCTACYMHATLQIFPHLLPDMQAKVSKCLGLWKWNAEARCFCFHSYFSCWSKRWNNWNSETKFERNMPFLSNFEDKMYFLRCTWQVHLSRLNSMTIAQVLSVLATQLSDICHKCCEFWVCVQ